MGSKLRVGIIGCGAIGGFILDSVQAGKVEDAEVIVVCGRSEKSKGRDKVKEYGIQWVTDPRAMLGLDLDVIIEAASHQILEDLGNDILKAGIHLITVSLGPLVDSKLLSDLMASASEAGSKLHIPSGGIGGLDAVQAMANAGMSEVTMTTRKLPKAWKGDRYVEQMKINLDNLTEPLVLFEGLARDCVRKFPANINVAAALSLAGIGFDATQVRIIADPNVKYTTHEIRCSGDAGHITMVFEDVPMPENPKTAYLASLSTLAKLRSIRCPYHIGS